MPRSRRARRKSTPATGNRPASGDAAGTRIAQSPAARGEGAENAEKSGRGLVMWVAGIVSAVLAAAAGVVFTGWFNTLGPGVFDEVVSKEPLTVAYVSISDEGPSIALRDPVTSPQDRAILLGRADAMEEAAFLERHRAAQVGRMVVVAVLSGNRARLRIADVRPRVLEREPVSDSALLNPASAGEEGTIEIAADLDRPVPLFVPLKGRKTPYFQTKQIDLVRDEQVTLAMTLTACEAYYEFEFVATVVSDGRAEEVVIRRPGGLPFRLTGPAREYGVSYDEHPMGGWRPASASPVKQEC
ncbi:hypothetical protein [Nonomuraea gerenzanensis]|uniref:Uncharacterized protein n=1 Tax=Nonomuraea gerenzanensis TaxID=93944 RepID=A0A1M4EF90_9ACTN|nr:hypothetical protein [Nonomuraea gerenzanensis]UBU08959.1 hypothetical protein LCN96_31800 [Nonomuraea gerenzanensis]SBO97338.1 hypothetical protein BN4615_P6854 [Nonomuraea gerenzanensis]